MLLNTIKCSWLLRTWVSATLLCSATLYAEDVDWGAIGEARSNTAGQNLIGQDLKPYVLNNVDGKAVDLGQYLGKKPIYLKFWATWCTTCLAQMPHFEKLAQQYQDKVAVIAVNTGINDDIEDVQAYLQQHKLSMPVVRDDGSLARELQLTVTPQQVLVDHTGRIVWSGHKDDARFMKVLEQVATRTYEPPEQTLAKANKPTISISNKQLKSAPMFTAINGQEVAIRNSQRMTYLWFTSPWCEWYLAESKPNTAAACQAVRELASLNGKASWVGISIDVWADKAQVDGFIAQHHITAPFILDDDKALFSAFNVRDVPAVVVMQPDGSFEKTTFNNAKEVANFAKALTF